MIEYRLPRVTEVRHVREHRVWLQFEDGLSGDIDLGGNLTGAFFEPLRDPSLFAQVRIDGGALAWPNGADWSPEDLYDRVRAANGLEPHSIDDVINAQRAYLGSMPEISRFFGIVIRMLAEDHSPPHFHAEYGEYAISVTIRDGIVSGHFPRRALRLVLEWLDQHEAELMANWYRLRDGQSPDPIPPLS